jgi:DNA-binding CsgD family transcriptional regulator
MRHNARYNYSIYFDFIDSYLPSGFRNVQADDPIMQRLEELMEENDQFLLVMDLTQVAIVYASKRSIDMVNVAPERLTPYEMMDAVHPDDMYRFGMGRTRLMNLDKDLFIAQKGSSLLSTNIRMRRPDQEYSNLLFQCYLFFSPTPHKSVYELQLHTNIDWFKFKKGHFHYYSGSEMSLFRFPDESLLDIGHHLSARELDILKLIEAGLSSKQIAEQLSISVYTVDTHRGNILEKSGKEVISDVIYDLKGQGIL